MVNTLRVDEGINATPPSDIHPQVQNLNPNDDPNLVNLRDAQALADEKRIGALQKYIADGGGSLGKMARIGNFKSIIPDSIDEVGPRFEYSKEDSKKYLDELNKRHPIKQVLGEYYDVIVSGKKSLFDMSVIGKTEFETKLTSYIVASAQAGKWISIPFKYGFLTMKELAKEADCTGGNNNPFNTIKEYELLGFYEEIIKQSIAAKIFRQPQESRVHTFPKEHLIQDLMRRLGTNLESDGAPTEK
ncbi:MAG: hypothetical protein WC774_01855 [Candidatus Gracilibacteria bacterium]